ncbi:MAG: hypothetical protein Unbinned8472contig1000_72 [Prokaryotic dsDNA virus sp.]|nr:MAG: hypothetical protein Unbinned8472contig1000_72 [Prokaryotic dsDNA virus sp.]|tara:strand:+ start:42677 stop:43225 length:549 start_codon:yes stop_codon:yes gene_type:complete
MSEEFKDLVMDKIQEGRYLVYSSGKIYDKLGGRFICINDNGFGYKTVRLRSDSVKYTSYIKYVHRLVAHCFIPNPESKPQVGHVNHVKEDNRVENLYWCTQSENTKDGIKAKRINQKGNRGESKRLTKDEVTVAAKLRSQGLGVAEVARHLGRPRTTISSLVNGRTNAKLFQESLDFFNSQS